MKSLRRATAIAEESGRVDLIPPDIARYEAGNTGIPYVTRLDSLQPGPVVMINALTHGNELCGAIALDLLLREQIRPIRGSLILSFANVAAYRQFDARHPEASRYVDEDFNRVWDGAVLDGPRASSELSRARAMRPVLEHVDFLLDIHSMQTETEPLALAGTRTKGTALARRVGVPEIVVLDQGHAAGRRMRDYGAFDDPQSDKAALLVECGQHWLQPSADMAITACLRFLAVLELVEPSSLARLGHRIPDRPQRVIEVTDAVTVETDRFRFTEDFIGLEIIARAGTVIGHDGDRPIVTPYDDCVLIMPSRRLVRGQTAVRLGHLI